MRTLAPLSPAASPEADLRRSSFGPSSRRALPTPGRLARRRYMIVFSKWVLPTAALALLAGMALWPELARWSEQASLRAAKFVTAAATGVLTDAHYNGVDERGRPYTVTAVRARQVSPQRVDLTQPKGDVQMEDGRWLMIQSMRGTYIQHIGSLDLSGDVLLYRDDGTVMQTDTATLDLRNGAASSADRVHVEGPFGTLDAQGFSLTDRGTQIQFWGPGRLVLNARQK